MTKSKEQCVFRKNCPGDFETLQNPSRILKAGFPCFKDRILVSIAEAKWPPKLWMETPSSVSSTGQKPKAVSSSSPQPSAWKGTLLAVTLKEAMEYPSWSTWKCYADCDWTFWIFTDILPASGCFYFWRSDMWRLLSAIPEKNYVASPIVSDPLKNPRPSW